ncbi:S-layer homology domain-containing protein [Paenibacillus sp. HB172176]|uniref:S-layer homology domain-containing protein n=1 Tax=Paenibacillus sp. HB172176 TaxID=2493690 RepID=UPI001F111D2F|nr:S-layer homology domain-containing protein [Paenibacillus sp. HB172176]
MKVKNKLAGMLAFVLLLCAVIVPMSVMAASDPDNGDWEAESVTLRNTSEAELMVRSGSINNVGFGFFEDENPFTAEQTWSHGYPWDPREGAAKGTDRIMLGTGYTGENLDGYSMQWEQDAEGAATRAIELKYDAKGIAVDNAMLQICVDDFQAINWGSHFSVTLNGKDAPFISEVLNHIDQTGPVVQIISIEIPQRFYSDIASGSLSVYINETTGLGDGFAIDFVKLLVNYSRSAYISTVEGVVRDEYGNPMAGATVRVLGTKNVVKTGPNGQFTAEVVSGLNAFRASKDGYIEAYDFTIAPAGKTVSINDLWMIPGKGQPDTNYSYFADGDAWSDASVWATAELEKAESMGLIPDSLYGEDLTKPVTRAEFAAVAVKVYESLTGAKALPALNNPFRDTQDVEVLKAYNANLVAGLSADRFAPNVLLNREQAATMLTRAFKKATIVGWSLANDGSFKLTYTKTGTFADDAKISSWAKESVYFMAANGIIAGTGNNNFSPRAITPAEEAANYASATREQALVIAVRMVENLK